jgi:hypothetical protein
MAMGAVAASSASHSHPSLVPSIIAAVSGVAAVLAVIVSNFRIGQVKTTALQNQIDQNERTELLVKAITNASDRQQDRFEQFIRDYFRRDDNGHRRRMGDVDHA